MRSVAPFVVLLLLFGCGGPPENIITGSGVIEGTEIVVSSKASGQIIEFNVREGAGVDKDQILARVDDEKLQLQKKQLQAGLNEMDFHITSARAALTAARANHSNIEKQAHRIRTLYIKGSSTQQQLDNVETQFKNADTRLTSANNNLHAFEMKKQQLSVQLQLIESQISDCLIPSPLAGTVLDKYRQQGEFVATGLPLLSIADLDHLWIKLYVSESDLGYVNLGAPAEISIDSYPDLRIKGEIRWISPEAEFTPHNVQTKEARADLVYAVKIELPNPDGILKIGMPADIYLNKREN